MQAELHLLQYKFVCYRICPALANKICITYPGLPWKRGYPQPFTLPWTRA